MSDNNEPTLSDDQADDQDRQSIKTPMARRQADKHAALLAVEPHLAGPIFSDEPNGLTSDIDPAASLCIHDGQASPADHDIGLATSLTDFDESTLTELASPTIFLDSANDASFSTSSDQTDARSDLALKNELLELKTQVQVLIDMSINSGSAQQAQAAEIQHLRTLLSTSTHSRYDINQTNLPQATATRPTTLDDHRPHALLDSAYCSMGQLLAPLSAPPSAQLSAPLAKSASPDANENSTDELLHANSARPTVAVTQDSMDQPFAPLSAPLPAPPSAPLAKSAPPSAEHNRPPADFSNSTNQTRPTALYATVAEQTPNTAPNVPTTHERATRLLIKTYSLAIADPTLLSSYKSKYLTNAITAASYFKSIREPVDSSLQFHVKRPGAAAIKALEDYATEFEGTVPCKQCTTAAVALSVLTEDSSVTRSAHVDMLAKICCNSSILEIYSMAAETKCTGRYDRSRAHKGPLRSSRFYRNFDPAMHEGFADWWTALWHFAKCFFGSDPSLRQSSDSSFAHRIWAALCNGGGFKQGYDTACDFIAQEQINMDAWEAAEQGTQVVTPKHRVHNILNAARKPLHDAFSARISLKNRRLHSYYKDWDEFTAELELAEDSERSFTRAPAVNNTAPQAAAKSTTTAAVLIAATASPAAAPLSVAPPQATKNDDCWNWAKTGVCSYGETCRYAHKGIAGADKHLVCDHDGTCKAFKNGRCNRKNCPFTHNTKSQYHGTAHLAPTNHSYPMALHTYANQSTSLIDSDY